MGDRKCCKCLKIITIRNPYSRAEPYESAEISLDHRVVIMWGFYDWACSCTSSLWLLQNTKSLKITLKSEILTS